jgi:hypothetical protein
MSLRKSRKKKSDLPFEVNPQEYLKRIERRVADRKYHRDRDSEIMSYYEERGGDDGSDVIHEEFDEPSYDSELPPSPAPIRSPPNSYKPMKKIYEARVNRSQSTDEEEVFSIVEALYEKVERLELRLNRLIDGMGRLRKELHAVRSHQSYGSRKGRGGGLSREVPDKKLHDMSKRIEDLEEMLAYLGVAFQ